MIVLLSLAINKQLDLQTLFTSALRQSARAEGWYGERRAYQLFFMEALAVAAVAGGVLLLWLTRRLGTGLKIASAGAIVLIAFVLMRAASFHHVDTLLRLEVGHLRLGWVIGLGGIGLVTAGALRAQ